MATSRIEGSWFPTGFYGHFRSKSRNDFVNEYRQLARPSPPRKFGKRCQTNPATHSFSHHDNRQSFLSDALYFEEGLGRRRIPQSSNRYKKDFIAWIPHKQDLEASGTLPSTYDFVYGGAYKKRQRCVARPKTSFDDDQKPTTTYRYAHGNEAPNGETLRSMNMAVLTSTQPLSLRATSARGFKSRDSVASCLTWHAPRPPVKRNVPLATQTFPPASTVNTTQAVPSGPPMMQPSPPQAAVMTE